MNNQIKRMDIKEFREIGLLQEVNRMFFHPRGLALEVIIDTDTGEEILGGIWDFRDDPEGICFYPDGIDPDKANRVRQLLLDKAETREEKFGFIIQPIRKN